MIIEFPKRYKVFVGMYGDCVVDIPVEYAAPLIVLFNQQPWIVALIQPAEDGYPIIFRLSGAYEITIEQARDAINRLCEHVMCPPVELDKEIWGEALGALNQETEAGPQ